MRLASLLLLLASPLALRSSAQAVTATCREWSTHDVPAAAPVITGKRRDVPAMRIRLLDAASGMPLPASALRVQYVWQWLRYPHPEHTFGGWTDAAEQLACEENKDGWVETPAHSVEPRGWYVGRYTRLPWPRGPEFAGVRLLISTPEGPREVQLKPRDVGHFDEADLVVRVFSNQEPETAWQPKQDKP